MKFAPVILFALGISVAAMAAPPAGADISISR